MRRLDHGFMQGLGLYMQSHVHGTNAVSYFERFPQQALAMIVLTLCQLWVQYRIHDNDVLRRGGVQSDR